MAFDDPAFWTALLKIIGVNIVLSGDNAVVIALAARSLPPKQQKQAIFWGSGRRGRDAHRPHDLRGGAARAAVAEAHRLGAAALDRREAAAARGTRRSNVESSDKLWPAIKTILIADLVMSLDNVIAVAAAAGGSVTLLVIGLAISIPLVIFGSTLLLKLMERWPIIITIGAGLLGFVAGEMAWEDIAIGAFTKQYPACDQVRGRRRSARSSWSGSAAILAGRTLRQSAAEHLEHQGAHPDPAAKTPDSAR